MKQTMRAFDGGRRHWSRTIAVRKCIKDGQLTGFINLSEIARSRCRWVAIPILPQMTARPDAVPAEAEG